MQRSLKSTLLTILNAGFWLLALLSGALGLQLFLAGAYPAPGEGSLGHVGIAVAGLVAVFFAVIFGLLGLYTGLRARALRAGERSEARMEGAAFPDALRD